MPAEAVSAEVSITHPHEIALYLTGFDQLREMVVYGSLDADVVVSWVTRAVDRPAQAAGAIGADARRMAGGLSGRARRRVLSGVDGAGA
ncbi:hypothetical protein [Streptomyces sp. YGL11-2]|uniref:hypothetical protein n=1 Tax=Streptomyces sp. YGL11-2 TaxID=3414028 RepID=UPI003CF4C44A